MINFYLDRESYQLLDEWCREHRWQTVNALPFNKKMSVHMKAEKEEIISIFSAYSKGGYKFTVLNSAKRQIVKGKLLNDETGANDFGISFTITCDAPAEELQPVISCACNAFLISNAFLWYGNLDECRTIKALSRNTESSKNIVFKAFDGDLYAVPIGSHRSPEGVFNVRGHFRFYKKSGKVIWIDSYMKGGDTE